MGWVFRVLGKKGVRSGALHRQDTLPWVGKRCSVRARVSSRHSELGWMWAPLCRCLPVLPVKGYWWRLERMKTDLPRSKAGSAAEGSCCGVRQVQQGGLSSACWLREHVRLSDTGRGQRRRQEVWPADPRVGGECFRGQNLAPSPAVTPDLALKSSIMHKRC